MKLDKSIKYILQNVMTNYLYEYHPEYKEMMTGFLDFLDSDSENAIYNKSINILDNIDYNKIYPELIDRYINQNAYEFGYELERFNFPTDVKKLMINNSTFINNLKGTKNSFYFMVRSLQKFGVDEINQKINKIIIDVTDNESWWDESRPFNYEINLSEEEDIIEDIIRILHPAGMEKTFVIDPIIFADNMNLVITEMVEAEINDPSRHNGRYNRDGSIHFGYIFKTPLTFTD